MGLMFSWATPEYLLDKMSLDAIVYYFNEGWEAKQTEAKVHWGTYGQLMSESDPEAEKPIQKVPRREELEPMFKSPEYEFRDGAVWKGSKKIIYYKE